MMLNQHDKTAPFKSAKQDRQLNPSYLYDIEIILQTKNWMKLDVRDKPLPPPKNNPLATN